MISILSRFVCVACVCGFIIIACTQAGSGCSGDQIIGSVWRGLFIICDPGVCSAFHFHSLTRQARHSLFQSLEVSDSSTRGLGTRRVKRAGKLAARTRGRAGVGLRTGSMRLGT